MTRYNSENSAIEFYLSCHNHRNLSVFFKKTELKGKCQKTRFRSAYTQSSIHQGPETHDPAVGCDPWNLRGTWESIEDARPKNLRLWLGTKTREFKLDLPWGWSKSAILNKLLILSYYYFVDIKGLFKSKVQA